MQGTQDLATRVRVCVSVCVIVRVLHMCIIFLKLLGIRFYLITRKQQQERRSERGKGEEEGGHTKDI